jgi:hypothetical protein
MNYFSFVFCYLTSNDRIRSTKIKNRKGAGFGSMALAHLLRWRLRNAGMETGAGMAS